MVTAIWAIMAAAVTITDGVADAAITTAGRGTTIVIIIVGEIDLRKSHFRVAFAYSDGPGEIPVRLTARTSERADYRCPRCLH